jgi:hypothetical protein
MGQENITLILLAIIGLVFLIDFIKNNSKKSIDKSVEEFVKKEDKKLNNSNPVDWILNRKKNISLSIILIPLLKVLTHFLLFPNLHEVVVDNLVVKTQQLMGWEMKEVERIKEIKEMQPMELGSHFEVMFIDRLELFIPVTLVFLIVVWFFNDKIKAQ